MSAKVIGLPISEATLHRVVSEWLELALQDDTWFSTFPSGGGGMIRGAQLKASGLKAGVPDILVIHRSQAYWIELKAKKGTVKPVQSDCHDDLVAAGSRVAVCRSIQEVARALKEWSIPYRIFDE